MPAAGRIPQAFFVRIGIFSNRRAGGGGAEMGKRSARAVEWALAHRDVVHVEVGRDAIAEGLRRLAGERVDLLVVNGGDGTLQRVLTELLRASIFDPLPLVAPLRSGRTNMNALDIGSHRDPVRALELLYRRVSRGEVGARVVERAVLRVDLGPREGVHHGMFCGFGLIHRAIELTHRTFPAGRAQGVFGAGLITGALAVRAAFGSAKDVLSPDAMELVLDDQAMPVRPYKLLIMTTLSRLFLGLRPFWGTEPAPVRVTAIAEGGFGMRPALAIVRGRKPSGAASNGDGCFSLNVHRSEVRLDCGLTIDGEMYQPRARRRVRIDARPGLRFVRTLD